MHRIPQAIIHIGKEKTASTAIQMALLKSERQLKKERTFYYRSEKHIDCRPMVSFFSDFSPSDDYLSFNNIYNELDKKKHFERFAIQIDEDLAKIRDEGYNKVIFSSEHFHSQFFGHNAVRILKEWLSNWFENVAVVMLIRDPKEAVESLYSTALRCGHNESATLFMQNWHSNFAYSSPMHTYQRWAPHFQVKVIIFEPKVSNQVESIISTFGPRSLPKSQTSLYHNPGMTTAEYKLLKIINRYFPRFKNGEHIRGSHYLGRVLRRIATYLKIGPKWKYAGKFDAEIQTRYQSELEEIRRFSYRDLN